MFFTKLGNKRSKSNDECDSSSNKKLCVESKHIILSNKESNKNMELHETSDLPECWNKCQYQNFKTVNEWLVVKNKDDANADVWSMR